MFFSTEGAHLKNTDTAERMLLSGMKREAAREAVRLMEHGAEPEACLMILGSSLMESSPERAAIAFSMVPEGRFKKIALLNEGIALAVCEPQRSIKPLEQSVSSIEGTREERVGAVTYRASRPQALMALSTALQKIGEDERAIQRLEELLNDPSLKNSGVREEIARLDLAYCRMRRGIFDARSWELYESRWGKIERTFNPPHNFRKPRGTVLVYGEQGYGDNIQFARFTRNLREMGAERIIMLTHPSLRELFGRMPWVDSTATPEEPVPEHDARLPIMSLPHLLGLGDNIESEPYLSADPDLAREMDSILPRGRRIGIAWRGGSRNAAGPEVERTMRERNVPLELLVSKLKGSGRQLVSLQPENDGELLEHPEVHDPARHMKSHHHTAAIMMNLDLVVSVDTGVAHLAGSLGRPTIVLDRLRGDWRWGRDGTMAERWYPSMRMLRQSAAGDWAGPMATLEELSRGPSR